MRVAQTVRAAMYVAAFSTGLSVYPMLHRDVPAKAPSVITFNTTENDCRQQGNSYVRTTLYFGTNQRLGRVSEREWRDFLNREVTPRFPSGLTVLEASGQWRGEDGRVDRERSKVLLILHDGSEASAQSLKLIGESYKRQFQQESILSETARVCAAF